MVVSSSVACILNIGSLLTCLKVLGLGSECCPIFLSTLGFVYLEKTNLLQ